MANTVRHADRQLRERPGDGRGRRAGRAHGLRRRRRDGRPRQRRHASRCTRASTAASGRTPRCTPPTRCASAISASPGTSSSERMAELMQFVTTVAGAARDRARHRGRGPVTARAATAVRSSTSSTRPDGRLLYQDTSGHWSGVLRDLRPDVAILAAAGRGNIDGEPIQGSLADFVARQVEMLQPRSVVLSHHDDWLPGFSIDTDVTPIREAIERVAPVDTPARARLRRRHPDPPLSVRGPIRPSSAFWAADACDSRKRSQPRRSGPKTSRAGTSAGEMGLSPGMHGKGLRHENPTRPCGTARWRAHDRSL